MRDYFTRKIDTLADAEAFFLALHADDLTFHPEDAPDDLFNISTGKPTFSADEVPHIRARIAEAYRVMPDPCAFILSLDRE